MYLILVCKTLKDNEKSKRLADVLRFKELYSTIANGIIVNIAVYDCTSLV